MKTVPQLLARYLPAVVLAAALLPFTGCVTPRAKGFTSFLGYEGRQENWPRSTSALTKADFVIPAYLGLPSRPYQVIGFVVNTQPTFRGKGLPGWLWTDQTRLANACNQAQAHGAEAIVLSNNGQFHKAFDLQPGIKSKSSHLLSESEELVVAIKWADKL